MRFKLMVVLALLLVPVCVGAEPTDVLPNQPDVPVTVEAPPAPNSTNWEVVAVNIVTVLQGILVPAFVGWLRKYMENWPRLVVMSMVAVAAILSEALATVTFGGDFNLIRGAFVFTLAVTFREIGTTFRDHKLG